MHSIHQYWQDTIHTIVDQHSEMRDCLFLTEFQIKPLFDLEDGFIRFESNIGDIRVHHECEQVEYKICALPQRGIRCVAVRSECLVVCGVCAAHPINHLFAQLHRREPFRVSPKNVAKVGVEEVAYMG